MMASMSVGGVQVRLEVVHSRGTVSVNGVAGHVLGSEEAVDLYVEACRALSGVVDANGRQLFRWHGDSWTLEYEGGA